MCICIYLVEAKFALSYSKMNCAGPVKAVFEYTGIKHCDFYTSSNTAVSGNSTVDLFVIGFFFSKHRIFFAKIASCRPI